MRLLVILALMMSAQVVVATEKITVIANQSVISSLDKNRLRSIYLLKQQRWPDETPIIVVNRSADSPVRKKFEQFLGVQGRKYALYLKKMHYKGVRLPVIQNSKKAVLAFLENVPGAIAYVEGKVAELPPHVKVIGQLP